jgi:deoxyhypusine synthase
MTGTEFRNLVGKHLDAQERANGTQPGLLSTCWKNGIPVFVGAPGDGSAFLNSVKLWALDKLGELSHKFEIDVHAEVFESCAYHYWGLKHSDAKRLGILILGGGVPKNFSLQPEPTLSQIFRLPGIAGYDFDVQIVGASVTDGSLTGCKGQEAHTWGKVSAEALVSNVESYQTDYSTIMPLVAWALLDKRRRLANMRNELGLAELRRRHPETDGYLRENGQLRLFDRREELTAALFTQIGRKSSLRRIRETLDFPLAVLQRASGEK